MSVHRLGRRVVALLFFSTALVVVGLATPAHAEGELGVEAPKSPLFDVALLAPGMTGSETVTVTNYTSAPGDLVVQVVNLRDDDNGCNDAEKAHPDTTCGSDGGELSRDLQIKISDSSGITHYEGSLRDLSDGTRIDSSLQGGERTELTFAWELPLSSPNDTQSDRVGFDIEISLTGDIDDAEVAGVSLQRGSPVTILGAQLPRTGIDLGLVAQGGIAAIVVGAVAKLLAARWLSRDQVH